MKNALVLQLGLAGILSLAACGGGSGTSGTIPGTASSFDNRMVLSTSTVPSPKPTPSIIPLWAGRVYGYDNQFNPTDGDTASGGQGQVVDGIPCQPTMNDSGYHVHSYLGIIASGTQIAVPDGIGMEGPNPNENWPGYPPGFVPYAKCFYWVHTHDADGYVHQELPKGTLPYTLGTFFDLWGRVLSSTNVGADNGTGLGGYSGQVRVFTAVTPNGSSLTGPWQEYLGDPRLITLKSHEAIMLEIGPPFYEATQLPQVKFYTQY